MEDGFVLLYVCTKCEVCGDGLLFVDDTLIFCEANPDHFHDLCSLFL
jgi:hypothetical protein